jgi:glycosyltransferase involved in cell wall biosynthesis
MDLHERSAPAGGPPPAPDYLRPIRLSVAAPAFNEEGGIEATVGDWIRYLGGRPGIAAFEIVVCNDGSRDRTGAILDALAGGHRQVRPLHFSRNQGAAAALAAAISATTMDWVLLTDSDGQFPIENVEAMIAAVRRERALAAIGVRRKKDRLFARFGTASSGMLCNLAHRSSLRDFNSAFKLVWGPLLRSLCLEAKGMNYSTEVTSRLLECGVSIAQVDIEHRARISGASNMRMLRGAAHRMLFVAYIAMRQLLLSLEVLRRPPH